MRRILLICGSVRAGSTNAAALRTAAVVAPAGVEAVWFDGLAALPHFHPDAVEPFDPAVVALREALAAADAVLFCTPEYAGSLPAVLKNLLEWTVGSGEFNGKPVGCVNVALPPRGAAALAELRTVLGYIDARFVPAAWVEVFVPRDAVGPDGLVADPAVRSRLAAALGAL